MKERLFSNASYLGLETETFKFQNIQLTVRDAGGIQQIRSLWEIYFRDIQGIIFVVDSHDYHRIVEARVELHIYWETMN